MKKTLLSLLLAITMLILFAVPTFAAGGSLSATATTSEDGTSFTIDLVVNNNPGVIALTGKVSYDSKVVKLTSAKSGVVYETPFMTSQSLDVNPYQIIWMDATARKNNVTNGVLATYTFEVLKNAPNGESEIKFEVAEAVNRDKGDVTFTPCSFKINVKGTVSEGESSLSATASGNVSASTQNKIPNNQTIIVQKPLTDNTVNTNSTTSQTESATINTESTETDSSILTIGGSSETINSDYEDDFGEDGFEGSNNNRTVITIVVIAAVLALGLGVTATALYFRKKSGK